MTVSKKAIFWRFILAILFILALILLSAILSAPYSNRESARDTVRIADISKAKNWLNDNYDDEVGHPRFLPEEIQRDSNMVQITYERGDSFGEDEHSFRLGINLNRRSHDNTDQGNCPAGIPNQEISPYAFCLASNRTL